MLDWESSTAPGDADADADGVGRGVVSTLPLQLANANKTAAIHADIRTPTTSIRPAYLLPSYRSPFSDLTSQQESNRFVIEYARQA
jgi:hypothetical protein